MATRNPNNTIEFGVVNFGATISVFAITAATGAAGQTNPGENMEGFVEAAAQKGTMMGMGAMTDTGDALAIDAVAFNLYMEGSSWTAADLETAVQAVGGIFESATVTDAGL